MMDVVAWNFDKVNQMWYCILHLPTSTNLCIFTFFGNTKRHNAQNTKHPKPMLSTNSNKNQRHKGLGIMPITKKIVSPHNLSMLLMQASMMKEKFYAVTAIPHNEQDFKLWSGGEKLTLVA